MNLKDLGLLLSFLVIGVLVARLLLARRRLDASVAEAKRVDAECQVQSQAALTALRAPAARPGPLQVIPRHL